MKYVLEYKIRTAGLSHDQNFANQEALLTAFGQWKPEEGLTVHAFLGNLASDGGYVLVEAASPAPSSHSSRSSPTGTISRSFPWLTSRRRSPPQHSHLPGPVPRRAADTLGTVRPGA